MSAADTAAELVGSMSDAQVIEALTLLDAKPNRSEDERRVRAWLIESIESRYPDSTSALDSWADDPDDDREYVDVLIAALPESVRCY